MPRRSLKPLTAQKLKFVDAIVGEAEGNASLAAELAGWSRKSARVIGSRLLRDPRIREAIVNKKQQLEAQALTAAKVVNARVMSGDEALERLTTFARADIGQILGPDDPLSQLPDDVRATIKSVRPTRYGRVIECYDAMRATELMAKAGGKLVERHDVKVTRSLEDILAEVNALERERASA